MADKKQETFDVYTPAIGRGRGLFSFAKTSVSETPGPFPRRLFGSDSVNDRHEPLYSTPTSSNENATQQLRELIGELGSQIGESIAGRLLACQTAPISQQPPSANPSKAETLNATADLSKVSLIVRPDIKDPPMYRGDGTDKYSIQEWIDMVEVYLHKRELSANEQVDEVLSHLLGRAKSIVKVGLKSSVSANIVITTETIYCILRRYFSETPGSCLPVADFYATRPTAKETPVDYWVRLNTAAEAADQHLKRQGGKMDNMDSEIAMMFIRNCPDSNLACVFKCKPIGRWSLIEVQEAIDEHQREHHAEKSTTNIAKAHALQMATAVTTSEPSESNVDYTSVNSAKLTSLAKPSEAAVAESSTLE